MIDGDLWAYLDALIERAKHIAQWLAVVVVFTATLAASAGYFN